MGFSGQTLKHSFTTSFLLCLWGMGREELARSEHRFPVPFLHDGGCRKASLSLTRLDVAGVGIRVGGWKGYYSRDDEAGG